MEKISVKINGNEFEFENSLTVAELLIKRSVTGTMFVVEKNLEIVPKEEYSSAIVKNADVIEIVGFFGGG